MGGYTNEGVLYEWDEERDGALTDKYKVWICDRKETLRCGTPFDMWMIQHNYNNQNISYAFDYFQVPECRGMEWRLKDGWLYITSIPTTPEQAKAREPEFVKRLQPWMDDFEKEYKKGIAELMERYTRFKALDMASLEDWELKDAFEEFVNLYRRKGAIHFIWMIAFCSVYGMFEEMCQQILQIDKTHPQFHDLLAGFDHKILDTDRKMFQLGQKAKDLGLEPVFNETKDDKALLEKLKESDKGREWLQSLNEFVNEYGWRTIGNWDAKNPTWVEDPSLTIPGIRQFMGAPTFLVDEAREKLIQKREEAEKDALAKVPEDKKERLTKLLRAAQWAQICDEEHVFFTENYGSALGRYVTKEIGKRFAEAGAIDEPDDLYYLLPEEIVPRIINKYSARSLVAARKEEHKRFREREPEPFIGDTNALPQAMGINVLVRSTIAPMPNVRPELGADLYGTVATPGAVEGVVNRIMTEDDFDKFEAGSILVTVETSSAWTPLFNMAKAVITDVGGVLSHSAIIGREYGLPVISGTVEGTKKLKTGMKVKVDGNAGVVYILDK